MNGIRAKLLSAFRKKFGQQLGQPISAYDYSFGLVEAREVHEQVANRHFHSGANLLSHLPSDTLTQTVDHLSLNSPKGLLERWVNDAPSDSASLVMGAYHSHMSYVARGYGLGSSVGEDGARLFVEYQSRARGCLEGISQQSGVKAETLARLTRIYMGQSDTGNSCRAFENCISIDRNHLWAYIHMHEAAQPKWGGSEELFSRLYAMALKSQNPLIKRIIQLKTIWDSYLMLPYGTVEILLGRDEKALHRDAVEAISNADRQAERYDYSSVHVYILYNYIARIAEKVQCTELEEKYDMKTAGNFCLYPYGIQQRIE